MSSLDDLTVLSSELIPSEDMCHTGFLCTESRLWEIKVLFGTY